MSARFGLLVAIAGLLAPLPAAADGAEPPVLRGINTVSAVGAASVDVVLPERASFVARSDPPRSPGWADISTTGSFAALLIVSKTETTPGGSTPVNIFQLDLVAPDACSADLSPATPRFCLNPYRHVFFASPTPPSVDQGRSLYPYEPGPYTIYLLTDPGATVTATFELRGLEDATAFEAQRPASVEFDRIRNEGPALASINGAHTHVVGGSALAWVGFHHVAATPQAGGLFNYAECLTRGTPGPASPNECIPALLLGDVSVAGQPVLVRPTTGANHVGATTLENSGLMTLQSAVILGPGLWTNTFRVQRGGPGPAVAAWALWLELP